MMIGKWPARLGLAALAAFVVLHGAELYPSLNYWPNQLLGARMGAWKILLNAAVVIAFLGLLPYRRSTRAVWRSRGLYSAFALALMTEMLGWPLLAYLLSPVVQLSPEPYAHGVPWRHVVGTAMSLSGIALVFFGWRRIHAAQGLVSDGLYGWMRHPQYTGILFFALGWAVHFPTWMTWAFFPVLAWAYRKLALEEESAAHDEFGDEYAAYACRTARFIPFVA